jgi:hypothetical protein
MIYISYLIAAYAAITAIFLATVIWVDLKAGVLTSPIGLFGFKSWEIIQLALFWPYWVIKTIQIHSGIDLYSR